MENKNIEHQLPTEECENSNAPAEPAVPSIDVPINDMESSITNRNEELAEAPTEASSADQKDHRAPLVLPLTDAPVRTRPAVTEEDLQRMEVPTRTRPAVSPAAVLEESHREIHNGRITGEKHSTDSTAAPIRTRTPEKNREITNGIPVRHTRPTTPPQETNVTESWSGKGRFALIAAALLGIILMLTAVVIAVNTAYNADYVRPADFSMNFVPDGELPDISDFRTKPNPALPDASESDTANESENPNAGTKDPDVESTPATETTAPVETAAPEARYTVTIRPYNREPITVTTTAMTVEELFRITGFQMLENDRISVELDSIIAADTVIAVDSVEYRTVEVTETIPFTHTTIEVQENIPRGESQITRAGEDGQTTFTYSVEFVNGQEVSRSLIQETVTKEPVSEICEVGVGGTLVGSDGVTYSYSYYRVVPATYYDIEGLTWVGTPADEGTVATNFDYIPLGTKLYIKNDKFDFGVRTVEDTGTMKGYEVDIWISHDNPQLPDFAFIGLHYDMVIYYLD